ncbi:hypothetical protein X943_000473 [Babesia divergens]|uniref:Uncharacterized protein n=1 Tax=Babesia divergens TaxID=32595 RepID=A0AAD9LGI1_BABDI|nr:hypothetical protein X943_000473 [Babesia divergens]
MDLYCPFILVPGLVIALGIFTKTALWYNWGEYFITRPHVVLKHLGISNNATGKLVALGFIMLSINAVVTKVMELGGFKDTVRIMLSVDSYAEGVNRPIVNALLSSTLAALIWTFILHYYTRQQELHRRIIEMQEQNEYEFILNNCLQFREECKERVQ